MKQEITGLDDVDDAFLTEYEIVTKLIGLDGGGAPNCGKFYWEGVRVGT